MSVNHTSKLEIKVPGGAWVDVTSKVASDITGFYGKQNMTVPDRNGDIGFLKFTLYSSTPGYWMPTHPSCMPGWGVGTYVRYTVTYNAVPKVWYGKIYKDGIAPNFTAPKGVLFVDVTANDYIQEMVNYQLRNQTVRTNKTLAQCMAYILAEITEQPLSVTYNTNWTTFPSVFDTLQPKTFAASEIAKYVNSEMGAVYMISNGALVVDGRYSMNARGYATLGGTATVTQSFGSILDENGLQILDENGLPINGSITVSIFADQHKAPVPDYGELINSVVATMTPRKTDSSDVTLYSLASPTKLTNNTNTTIVGRYSDPNAKASKVSASSITTPVATTNYTATSQSDGTGADFTSKLTLGFSYTANEFTANFSNTNTVGTIYLATLTVKGKGVYLYDSLTVTQQDANSISTNGMTEQTFDFKYLNDYLALQLLVNDIIQLYHNVRVEFKNISYTANLDDNRMKQFIYIEPGQRILLTDSLNNTNQDYHILGVNFVDHRPFGKDLEYSYNIRNSDYSAVGV